MPATRFQPSFAAGVLGPGLHGRVDIAKYDVGLKTGENVFVHAHGGVSSRAGLEFVAKTPYAHLTNHRLIPFQRDGVTAYVLVFSHQKMTVISPDGSFVDMDAPFVDSHVWGFDYAQSIDVLFLAHKSQPPKRLEYGGSGPSDFTFVDIDVDPPAATTTISSVTAAQTGGTRTYSYKVAPVRNGVEGFASAAASVTNAQPLDYQDQEIDISWSAVTDADEYNVYRERSGVYGYIGFTAGTTFTDDNISANLELTPIQPAGVFGGPGDYPTKVSIYQQRIVFGGSVNQPETVWMSRVGDYSNFTKSRILKDDDRVELDITGAEINTIRNLMQLREMIVFTSSGEFTLTGPGGVMVATNPIQTQYGYSGSTDVKPLVVENTLIFVDRTGRQVRDLRYAFEQDGYTGNDLTIFASHFFEGRQIKDWCYQKNPYSIVWVCLDDGTLLSLTYKREHQVWAWTKHDVGGAVESVTSIKEGSEDHVYFVVKRTIGGTDYRYVERLHDRDFSDVKDAFFVDSGITYSGAATTTITGLSHLEGETVVALADGFVVEDLTVSGGSVTLPSAASKVHVGLPYTAKIGTLPPPITLQDVGHAKGRPIKASRLFVQLEKTRGIKAGPAGGRLADLIMPRDDYSVAEPVFTGMQGLTLYPEWNTDGGIEFVQSNPLPMSILGISPDYSVGRS